MKYVITEKEKKNDTEEEKTDEERSMLVSRKIWVLV